MRNGLIVILLLIVMFSLSGCEALFGLWGMRGWVAKEAYWGGSYPMEDGEYWIYTCWVTEYEKIDLDVETRTYARRDSVVVLGEDELSNSQLATHVVDYWSCNGDSGEIHHYYIQEEGLYCLALKYVNGLDLNSDDSPQFLHHVELSPLPGHAILEMQDVAENTEILETPRRKVLNTSYLEGDRFSGTTEWGEYFSNYIVSNKIETYQIWDCVGIHKEYWVDDTWRTRIKFYDFLGGEGLVKREIVSDYREILDQEGNGTGVYKKYELKFRMVDGTYQH